MLHSMNVTWRVGLDMPVGVISGHVVFKVTGMNKIIRMANISRGEGRDVPDGYAKMLHSRGGAEFNPGQETRSHATPKNSHAPTKNPLAATS